MRTPVVAALTLLAAVPIAAQTRPKALEGVHRIVCLGDSITQAGGPPGGYVWLLDRYLNTLYGDRAAPASATIEIVNAGISGHKSTDMQARFRRDVLDKSPDLVTINVGINDVWHGFRDFAAGVDHPKGDLPAGVPLPLYCEKVTEMIVAAQAAHIRVVLVSPTVIYEDLGSPENARLNLYVAAMRDLARRHDCLFVDLNAPFKEIIRAYQKYAGHTSNLLTVDGVHMNAAGNRVMACTILRGLGVPESDIAGMKITN